MNSITAVDDIPYIAALIWQLDGLENVIPEEQLNYTRGLILIASGIYKGTLQTSEVYNFQDAVDDFVENFKTLYPQYFNNIHPAFLWVVGIVAEEEMSYNQG